MMFLPSASYALTSGPAQEEFASFEPVGTTDMVDLFSGDFNYNIPLLSVPGPNGGYPINIAYHSGIGMDQEASWVGLGWNVNVGAINRQMRGLPDDFSGNDEVTQTLSLRNNNTTTIDIPDSKDGTQYAELFGIPVNSDEIVQSRVRWQVYYNSYKGLGYRLLYNPQKLNKLSKGSAKIGVSFDSQNGLGVEADLTMGAQGKNIGLGLNISTKWNTREGLKSVNFNTSLKAGKARRIIASYSDDFDKKGRGISGGNSSLSYGLAQSVPSVTIPTKTNTYAQGFMIGDSPNFWGDFAAGYPKIWNGSFTETKVMDGGIVKSKPYGYLYTPSPSANIGDDLLDFNRAEFSYSKKIPNLPPASYTHDLFLQSGQGTGGMMRPYRSNVSILSTRKNTSENIAHISKFEIAATTPYYHIGADYTNVKGSTVSGDWESDKSELTSALVVANGNPDYEEFYFKQYGEKSGELLNQHNLSEWEGSEALRVVLGKENGWFDRKYKVTDQVTTRTGSTTKSISKAMAYKKTRQRRTKVIRALPESAARDHGMSRHMSKNFNRGDKHISEVEVIQPDGMRYTYGLPTYNELQIEANLAVNGAGLDHSDVTIPVNANSHSNTFNRYLSKTKLPPYACSWLLTSVVSTDYVDLTNNGPSDDDYGYWVKFKYNKTTDNYKWRVPYQEANFQEGNRSDTKDDAAYYSYGEKQLYYLDVVESKSHIAIFHTSDREDAVEAQGEYATVAVASGQTMKKLDKIELFSKNEYYTDKVAQIPNLNAVAVKTVHFEYDYTLCPFVPNNTTSPVDKNGVTVAQNNPANVNALQGKLTLKKLFFTYEKSTRGALSPYEFEYGDVNFSQDNPDYDPRNIDRWGNYQSNTGVYDEDLYPHVDFPYTRQDRASHVTSDTPNDGSYEPVVAQWTLKKIELPTGGTLEIEYESDDYAYVEDKKPLRMYDVVGLGNNIIGAGTTDDFDETENDCFSSPCYPYRDKIDGTTSFTNEKTTTKDFRIYFELDEPVPASITSLQDRATYIHKKYIKGLDKIWFKTLIDLKKGNKPDESDFVSGYAEVVQTVTDEYMGVATRDGTGPYSIGYFTVAGVKLNKVNVGGAKIHPFRKAAFQHLKVERSDLVHNVVIPDGSPSAQITNLVTSVFKGMDEIVGAMISFNLWAYTKGFARTAYLDGHTIVRLLDSDQKKYGGGARVKKLTMNDNWTNTTADNARYGQEFSYVLENGKSSGVAYEPTVGGEESALTNPINYEESIPLSTTKSLYVDKPIMRNYYPGASVGYSRVVVASIAPEEADLADDNNLNKSVTLNATNAPVTIYEFYTPKDFPVVFKETDMTADPPIVRPLAIPGVYSTFKKRKARSQGYAVTLNDMAGKPKSISQVTRSDQQFGKESTLISKREYIYNTNRKYDPEAINVLDNSVQVLTSDGTYETAILGQEYDVFIDMNENIEKSKARGIETSFDLWFPTPTVPPAAIFWIMPLPFLADNEHSFKTVVMNKVIYSSGILKEIITTNDESVIKMENLAYDLETGAPLLTKVTNEFKDPVFSYSYPAHWYYEGMAGAYKNTDIEFEVRGSPGGSISLENSLPAGKELKDYFNIGDLVLIDNSVRAHIVKYGHQGAPEDLTCVREDGTMTGAFGLYYGMQAVPFKVIRSAKKNLLGSNVGNVLCKSVPNFNSQSTATPVSYSLADIVDASAIEFSDEWQIYCDAYCEPSAGDGVKIQDFLNVWVADQLSSGMGNFACFGEAVNYGASFRPELHFDIIGVYGNSCSFSLDLISTEIVNVVSFSDIQVNPNSASVGANTDFLITVHFSNGSTKIVNVTTDCPCLQGECFAKVRGPCGSAPDDFEALSFPGEVNPWAIGIKGRWHPKRSYAFVTDRVYDDNIQKDGIYDEFIPFPWTDPSTADLKWVSDNTITKFSPYGFQLEQKDALGRYSASIYGYENSLVKAFGSNSRYNEMGFDGFEDYADDCQDQHFKFLDGVLNNVFSSSRFSHTGNHAMAVASGGVAELTSFTLNENCDDYKQIYKYGGFDLPQTYKLDACDCLGEFSPIRGKKYVLSAWVREFRLVIVPPIQNYITPIIEISFLDGSGAAIGGATQTMQADGAIIEDWQRIFQEFTVPSNANKITVRLLNHTIAGLQITNLFDDVRIHPFDGNMSSYVYDPISLKLAAELDANNYATFYIYDAEGQLSKTKKETIAGIKTIREGRTGIKTN